jgi:hypothetical protein
LPHERPVYLLLPPRADLGAALARLLADADVRVTALPPLWFLDPAGIDLVGGLPGVRALTLESLPIVVAEVRRRCTAATLRACVERTWKEADEQLRLHFLKQGALRSIAAIFGFRGKSRESPPPESFVAEQVRTYRLECQYRLAPAPLPEPTPAPAEEGSLIVYPFDLDGALSRLELCLPAQGGPVIELFAYAWQHERHSAFWARLATELGGELRGG